MSLRNHDSAVLDLLRNEPGQMPAELLNKLLRQADTIGPCTSEVVLRLWKEFLNCSFDCIRKIFDLAYSFSEQHLEDACLRVLFYDFHSLHVIRSIIM